MATSDCFFISESLNQTTDSLKTPKSTLFRNETALLHDAWRRVFVHRALTLFGTILPPEQKQTKVVFILGKAAF